MELVVRKILVGLKERDDVNLDNLVRYLEKKPTDVMRMALQHLWRSVEASEPLDLATVDTHTMLTLGSPYLKVMHFNKQTDRMIEAYKAGPPRRRMLSRR